MGGRVRNIAMRGNVRPAPSTRPAGENQGLNSQGQNPPHLERAATHWIIPGGSMTRPGGTNLLRAV